MHTTLFFFLLSIAPNQKPMMNNGLLRISTILSPSLPTTTATAKKNRHDTGDQQAKEESEARCEVSKTAKSAHTPDPIHSVVSMQTCLSMIH
jgi:hypothetical protein